MYFLNTASKEIAETLDLVLERSICNYLIISKTLIASSYEYFKYILTIFLWYCAQLTKPKRSNNNTALINSYRE